MKAIFLLACVALFAQTGYAGRLMPAGVELLCHRTANEDVPENTLESLDQAALLGCNVVEIDLRRTLDGRIVLNHDGILERLTDGVGEVEQSDFAELQLLDAGSWMGERFAGMHIVLFEDALRLARERRIRLVLDMKDKGLGADVLGLLKREGMLDQVQFNGEWTDVKALYPAAADVSKNAVWVQPGVTVEQVAAVHRGGKAVIANFSANPHEMDLAAMKAAVAAGVDGINVDYPRLGADAVGRPVEDKIHALIIQAESGAAEPRAAAIRELSRFSGFPLQTDFTRWLLDPDNIVSRTAAVALVQARPRTPPTALNDALRSEHASVRANAAWVLGMLGAPADELVPLLCDRNPPVLQAALLALARGSGDVSADLLLPLLANESAGVRGAAAMALARHQPAVGATAVPEQLRREIDAERALQSRHVQRGQARFTPTEIHAITESFRCQMQMVRAISMLKGEQATGELAAQAFRPGEDFSLYNRIVAAFQLWDRIGDDPAPAIAALGSDDSQVADRAEWMLVKASPAILPAVRDALQQPCGPVRRRVIRILAWQADPASLGLLRSIAAEQGPDTDLAAWAVAKIESLHPNR